MRLNLLLAFAGFIILVAGTWCPVLHPFIGNWDVYDGNKPYGIVLLLVGIAGILAAVLNQIKLVRLVAWLLLGLVVLFYMAALLKVHTSFNFIPFRSVAQYLSGKIKFKWGWYLLFGGPLLAITGVLLEKKRDFTRPVY